MGRKKNKRRAKRLAGKQYGAAAGSDQGEGARSLSASSMSEGEDQLSDDGDLALAQSDDEVGGPGAEDQDEEAALFSFQSDATAGSSGERIVVAKRDILPLLRTRERVTEAFFARRDCRFGLLACIVIFVLFVAIISSKGGDTWTPPDSSSATELADRTCSVFCHGRLLRAVQSLALFKDSKTFVDMPIRDSSPEQVLRDFNRVFGAEGSGSIHPDVLKTFVHDHFDTDGSDLKAWTPRDHLLHPPRLQYIFDDTLRWWAHKVNDLWALLGRAVTREVSEHPERHTLIRPASDTMMVAGGRFREMYYWDTYFIIRGLVVSGMIDTSRTMTENLLSFVDTYGFVPNGNRVYYLTRSQPPFLSLIVDEVYEALVDAHAAAAPVFLKRALPSLDKEYDYWMVNNQRAVSVRDSRGQTHTANRYYAHVFDERPESWREDFHTARHMTKPSDRVRLFSELAAAAESGWDFSSRWFADRVHLNSSDTTRVIPADLNGLMYGVERTLQRLHGLAGNTDASARYQAAAQARLDLLFSDVLFDGVRWRDYDTNTGLPLSYATISNYLPLWPIVKYTPVDEALPDLLDINLLIEDLLGSQLVQAGGLVTTLEKRDGQQWDWPDAWPPLQLMMDEALWLVGEQEREGVSSTVAARAAYQAEVFVGRWLTNNWVGYNTTHLMFEKYSAVTLGHSGSGGEYIPQVGFGWTNGVCLAMLDHYGPRLRMNGGQVFVESQ